MNLRDMLYISVGNLWRMKLRTFLTASGVVIAIAAFVAMLSFGAGMQENIADQFNNLGLFNTMLVYEKRAESDDERRHRNQDDEEESSESADSSLTNDSLVVVDTIIKPLDNEALKLLSEIRGVSLAYPFESFAISVTIDDSTYVTDAQALPLDAYKTKLYSELSYGEHLSSDSAKEILLTDELVVTTL